MVIQHKGQKILTNNRASSVLYKFLISTSIAGKFILPANICPIVPLVFKAANIAFIFVDINKQDLCIDYDLTIDLIDKNPTQYAGVLFNHTYGYKPSPTKFFKILKAKKENLIIIDDKCLCEPNFRHDTLSDLTLFSTGYAKHLDLGVGGLGIINSNADFKPFSTFYLENNLKIIDDNLNMDITYLDKISQELPHINDHKQKINNIYNSYLVDIPKLNCEWNNWRFNLLIPEKSDVILTEIFANKYFASKHYAPPTKDGIYPNTEELYSKVINLFNDKYMTCEMAEKIAVLIKRTY